MNDLLQFLSSSEAIIVYIVAAISCCLCFIIYLVERNNVKARQRHNTRELNKLVAKVKEEANIVDEPMYDVPVLQTIDEDPQEAKVAEMLAETQVLKVVKEPEVEILEESPLEIVEPIEMEPIDILQEAKDAEEEELQYTSIEPDRETAQMELRRITEELQKQEEEPSEEVITNYEALQEENAIISMDELVAKGKAMYDANELTQYVEEGNEPISISELEQQYGREAAPVNETFEIDKVVPDEEIEEVKEEKPVVVETEKKFKSSPIISPIFGIERQADDNVDIALENTANYDKLDQEIQKTNEFLMTLKDLQQKVD